MKATGGDWGIRSLSCYEFKPYCPPCVRVLHTLGFHSCLLAGSSRRASLEVEHLLHKLVSTWDAWATWLPKVYLLISFPHNLLFLIFKNLTDTCAKTEAQKEWFSLANAPNQVVHSLMPQILPHTILHATVKIGTRNSSPVFHREFRNPVTWVFVASQNMKAQATSFRIRSQELKLDNRMQDVGILKIGSNTCF